MITITALRNDLYNKIDRVITIDRPSKLALFPPKEGIVGDPEDIIYNNWAKEWRDELLAKTQSLKNQ